ncbi:MAG: D-alanine--D-alanine ligase [Clostridiales bacterium]|nr:D-alanine--D-alanine ligase [Clostridiales bacterium]
MKKTQLGVMFGSRSCEHEVSIISAVQMMKHVDADTYDTIPVYISQEGIWYTGEPLKDIETYVPQFNVKIPGIIPVQPDVSARSGALLSYERKGLRKISSRSIAARLDCVIPIFHGLHGEDGSMQGLLELMDLPYASTGIAGSAIAMDKILMKQCFRSFGFPVLRDVALVRSDWRRDAVEVIKAVEQKLGYPVFVKPANLGSSIGVSRADDFQSLSDALELAFCYDRRVMVEEAVNRPIEVNCAVLGYDRDVRVSVVEMPITGGSLLGFSDKYLNAGGSKGMASLSRVVPAPIGEAMTARVQELSLDIFRALDCKGVVRVDFMIDSMTDNLTITEINAIPGSLSFYLWAKSEPRLSYKELIDLMVKSAFDAYAEKNENDIAHRSDILKSAKLGGGKGHKGAKG